MITRTAGSNQQKLQRLLKELELGDRKPSQLLRRMHQLWCDGDTDDALLHELFLQRLPSSVCMVLAPSGTDISLNNLADRIIEVSTPTVAAVHALPPEPVPTELVSLRAEVRKGFSTSLCHPRLQPSAGTISNLGVLPPNTAHPVPRGSTTRPDTSCDGRP